MSAGVNKPAVVEGSLSDVLDDDMEVEIGERLGPVSAYQLVRVVKAVGCPVGKMSTLNTN